MNVFNVQQLVAEAAEERFGMAILPRNARLDVEHLQACPLGVTTNRCGDGAALDAV